MFQPQPTPFASSSFAPYGLAPDFGFGYQVSDGGGGAGSSSGVLYGSQLPLGAQQQSQPQPQQHHQQRFQPSLAQQQQQQQQYHRRDPPVSSSSVSTIPSGYGASTVQHQESSPLTNPQLAQHYTLPIKMEDDQAQHDLAAQQAAARDYQPEFKGPPVGGKLSSEIITEEYARADPVYVEKTAALPQTYSFYRPILGDGNCGWRAIGFSYTEKLIDIGDQGKIEGEIVRLHSLHRLLQTVGNYTYFEEFADPMFDLLRDIAQNMNNPSAAHLLAVQTWNEANTSDSMVYYLRLLAATYLRANAATYEPFAEAGSVAMHCQTVIEPVNREIEQLGIIALVNILLKPVEFVLEIAYLDRSIGSQVNTYRFPEEANGKDISLLGPIIYLLYRPNHYDILYRSDAAQIPAPSAPVSLQVHRVNELHHDANIASTNNMYDCTAPEFDALTFIPGFSMMGGMSSLAPPVATSPLADPFAPAPQGSWMSQFTDGLSTATPRPQPPPPQPAVATPLPPTPPAPLSPAGTVGSSSSSVAPTSGFRPRPAVAAKPPMPPSSEYQIRFSPVQLEYEESKNNFHPEEWSPEDENTDGRVGKKRAKRGPEPHSKKRPQYDDEGHEPQE